MDMAPFDDSSSSFSAMSSAWSRTAAKVAGDVLGLPEILASRLDELKASSHLDEKSLNRAVDDVVKLVQKRGNSDSAKKLDSQLRRYVYEYLLSLDAVIAKPPEAERVAVAPVALPPVEAPQPLPAEADSRPVNTVAPIEGFHLTDEAPSVKQIQTVENHPASAAVADPPVDTHAESESESRRVDLASIPLEDSIEGLSFENAAVVELPEVEASPLDQPEVAPEVSQPEPKLLKREYAENAPVGEWNVRRATSRPRQTTTLDEVQPYQPTEAEVTMRRDIEKLVGRRKTDLAAARVRRAIKQFPTSFMAEVALDMGDRMGILGKPRAAMNCYLAAIRCLPTYEEPFERLADLAMSRQDSGLAAAFFEQVAELRRARDDLQGMLRCYRKIVTIAPQRKDIAASMLRMKAAGEI